MPTAVVTGISGFLAAHVAHTFLKHGWDVRGTLRSSAKQSSFNDIPELSPYIKSGKLTFWVTGDLANGDYTAVVKGADAVVHTASPVEFDPDHYLEKHQKPAVNGTRGVLEAAAKEDSIKAVVATGTYGSIGNHREHPTSQAGVVVNEKDWNPYTDEELIKMSDENGQGGPAFPAGYLYYMGAKKAAELAAWDVQKETGNKFSLAIMNCVMIWGPSIHPLTSLSKGGMSTEYLYALLGGKDSQIAPTLFPYYVDVRDAAEAHYQAAVRQANGRFILSAGTYDFQEFADIVREQFPEVADRVPVGTPGKYWYKDPGVYILENKKSIAELGATYRPKNETVHDAFARIIELEKQGLN